VASKAQVQNDLLSRMSEERVKSLPVSAAAFSTLRCSPLRWGSPRMTRCYPSSTGTEPITTRTTTPDNHRPLRMAAEVVANSEFKEEGG